MANNYDAGLPTDLDKARFLLRDTATPWVFEDSELQWLIDTHANVWLAAHAAAVVLRGDVKSRKIGETHVEYITQSMATWKARGLTHQLPFTGGSSRAERDKLRDDDDYIQPAMRAGQYEHGGPNADDADPSVGSFGD
jgi:hypothetical protein